MNSNIFAGNDIISIISLCYVIILAKHNAVICEKKNKFYIAASIFTIITILLEIIDRNLASSNGYFIIQMHTLINVLGFSLIPAVPFILIFSYYNGNNKLINFLIIFPVIFNIIICVLSGFNGFVFSIDENNVYVRGSFFMVPVIIGIIYFFVLVLFISKSTIEYGKEERIFLWSIFLIVIFSSLTQIFSKDIYILWSSVSLALVLYYIFLREIQIKYDPLTCIRNRFAYEYDINKYKYNENIAIVMFDLNNLKSINDNNGHYNGDKAIYASARIIKDSFRGVGVPYRIGGDEFCVICRAVSKKNIDESLLKLTIGLDEINKSNKIKVGLAFGYSFFEKNCEDINDVIENADIEMYKHKVKLKQEAILKLKIL